MSPAPETPRPPATPEFGHVTPGGPAHRYPTENGVEITKLSVGAFDNNVYVLASAGEAVIIDGADDAERILREVQGLRVKVIVQTHNHADHVGALADLVSVLRAPVLAHADDPVPVSFDTVSDGDVVTFGDALLTVVHTPGHTPGSLCFRTGSHLFSGDTLFPGGPGNTFGDAAAFETIMRSVDGLFMLPDDVAVHPGHGLDTTIGRERGSVEAWRARGW